MLQTISSDRKSLRDNCKDQNINTETTEKTGGHREIASSAAEDALRLRNLCRGPSILLPAASQDELKPRPTKQSQLRKPKKQKQAAATNSNAKSKTTSTSKAPS